jgi:hypothetical protein
MKDAVARQFALGASGSPGIEFGFYAYILKEKRGNTWGTLKRKSGRLPRCRSALHAISSAVLFGLGECPQTAAESHLLLAIDSEELLSILQGAEIPKRSCREHLVVSLAVQKWSEMRMRCEVKYVQKKSFEPRLLCEKLIEQDMQLWLETYSSFTRDEFDDEMQRRAIEQQFWDEDDFWYEDE